MTAEPSANAAGKAGSSDRCSSFPALFPPDEFQRFLQLLVAARGDAGDRPAEGDGRQDADRVVLRAVVLDR